MASAGPKSQSFKYATRHDTTMATAEPTPVAEIDDDLDDLSPDQVDGMWCENCDHEWLPRKPLGEYNTLTCPECGKQAKGELHVMLSDPAPEPDDSANLGSPIGRDQSDAPEGWTAKPPAESATVPQGITTEDDDTPDFTTMSHGEFIRWFFKNNGFGVKEDFANSLAQQCDIRQELPDQQTLTYQLQSHNSGIGNPNDAQMLAEAYWSVAQRYLNARGQMGNQPQVPQAGGWVDQNQQPQNGQQPTQQPGSWISGPDGGYSQQQNGHQQNMHNSWVSGQGNTQPNQPPPQQQGMNPVVQQLMQQQQQMMERMQEMVQESADPKEKAQQNSDLKEQVQQFAELKQTLDQLGDDGDDEVVQAMQEQIQQLQQHIQAQAQEDMQMSGGENPLEMAAAQALMEGNISQEKADVLAQLAGVNADPDVKQVELEKEKEIQKEKMKTERWQQILSNINGQQVGELFGGLVGSLSGGSGEQPQLQDQPQEQRQDQPQGTDMGQDMGQNQGQDQGQRQQPQRQQPPDQQPTAATQGIQPQAQQPQPQAQPQFQQPQPQGQNQQPQGQPQQQVQTDTSPEDLQSPQARRAQQGTDADGGSETDDGSDDVTDVDNQELEPAEDTDGDNTDDDEPNTEDADTEDGDDGE